MNYRLYAVEAGCGTSVGAASTFANATEVRLFNNSSSNQLVTVANAADVTLGTMTLADGEVTFIMKDPTDQIFAAAATVLGTPVKYS
jgi:tryptophan synthase beta subunit|tara:strand:+ start:335 stop:595 length:261 start_codon:yes stop_codon:yes gene_type:complete